ncbi:hypothetical protein FB45DRAFT_426363 [Roridomyces roridus]|uniref:Uncharacterized protein n=1 Tax=Roridomyces roridus TaxID=1738132 RepID=A0AAD7C5R3_9AGAR|nr:hypothetical protein FB45DRAFT_426363 [Roridomyces roridus]
MPKSTSSRLTARRPSTRSCAPDPRVAAANTRAAAWVKFRSTEARIQPPTPPIPVVLELEDPFGFRHPVSAHNTDYATVMSHLRIIVHYMALSDLFASKMESVVVACKARDKDVRRALQDVGNVESAIQRFLQKTPPTFVVKPQPLVDEYSPDTIVWGQVNKADSPGAGLNEILISKLLIDAMVKQPPSDLNLSQTEIEEKRNQMYLLFYIIVMHEMMHAVTKHLWGVHIITPKLGCDEYNVDGHGEAGRMLEKEFFSFFIQVWAKAGTPVDHRFMWKTDFLAGKCSKGSKSRILEPIDIDRLLQSFQFKGQWDTGFSGLTEVSPALNRNTHVRYRSGFVGAHSDCDDSESESGEDPEVKTRMCATRPYGLRPSGYGLGIKFK